ncbi:hypothetical protein LB505_006697 [Fusarium chuoi]|nr:hypothetical protein LB505_006697 [Fusarium chuoi]
MTILGEIVDLHHAKNHPRFGTGFRQGHEWNAQTAEITRHLEIYEQSLQAFEHKNLPRPAEERIDAQNEGNERSGVPDANTPSQYTDSNRYCIWNSCYARLAYSIGWEMGSHQLAG